MKTFFDILQGIFGIGALFAVLWFFERYLGISFGSARTRSLNKYNNAWNERHITNYTSEQIAEAKKSMKDKFLANTSDNLLKELTKKFGEYDAQPKRERNK